MAASLIGHVDADCFYVSCERVRQRNLVGIPVGVLSNQGAIVIAKSYELKRAGVTTAMPIWDAVRLSPEAVFVKRDFVWYESVSRHLLESIRKVSPRVEYYSIDEQFFDARYLQQSFGVPLLRATRILQNQILREVGIPVSIGISRTKTLAKLISSSSKPFGCAVLTDMDEIYPFIDQVPVDAITGIARRRKRRLAGHSITTCGELARADRRLIRRLLTKSGEELWFELHGTVAKPILSERPSHKFIARGGSVGRATSDHQRLHAWLVRNVERLIEALDAHGVGCDELTLHLQQKSGLLAGSSRRLPETTARFRLLLEAARQLFDDSWRPGAVIQYMHLIAGKLSFRDCIQQSLFDVASPRERSLARVKREINARIGRFKLRSGATLALSELYHDEASDYDVCDIIGKTCF